MFHNRFLALILAMNVSILTACSGGGSGTTGSPGGGNGGGSSGPNFITWSGSSNAEWVVDGYGNFFKFRADTRQLWFSGTTFLNVRVTDAAQLIWNNSQIGYVSGVMSTSGTVIAALVSNQGTFIGIYEEGGEVYWTDTNTHPSFPALAAEDDGTADDRDLDLEAEVVEAYTQDASVLVLAPFFGTHPFGVDVDAEPPHDGTRWPERGFIELMGTDRRDARDGSPSDNSRAPLPSILVATDEFDAEQVLNEASRDPAERQVRR